MSPCPFGRPKGLLPSWLKTHVFAKMKPSDRSNSAERAASSDSVPQQLPPIDSKSATDSALDFATEFLNTHQDLAGRLSAADHLPDARAKGNEYDAIHRGCVELEKKVTEAATLYLPSYDVGKYMSILKSLYATLENQRAVARGGKRFTFRARNKLTNKTQQAASPALSLSQLTSTGPDSEADGIGSAGIAPATLAASGQAIQVVGVTARRVVQRTPATGGADLNVADAKDATIIVAAPPAGAVGDVTSQAPLHAAHLHALARSAVVVVAPIDGSVLIDHVRDSVLIVTGCRQFRMHHAENVVVGLYAVSPPIIEDCNGAVFVPLQPDRVAELPHGEVLTAHPNRSDNVQDFHWLAGSGPSPHWRLGDAGLHQAVDDQLRTLVSELKGPRYFSSATDDEVENALNPSLLVSLRQAVCASKDSNE